MITEFKMPKMGESISEATIIAWSKNVGDTIAAEETLVEVATDKVDSDVPSPVSGVITEIRHDKDAVVGVGEVLALIDTSGVQSTKAASESNTEVQAKPSASPKRETKDLKSDPDAFLSPLVISIAQRENLSIEEVRSIPGTGTDGRIRKSDVMAYLKDRRYALPSRPTTQTQNSYPAPHVKPGANDRIVEMDRMRQMIAGHMSYSKNTSPHVTSYLEVDLTEMVAWRENNKAEFLEKHDQKLTFTPLFIDAVAKALAEFPMMNVAVSGKNIVVRGDINIGMATALPSGNLIVPVVRSADRKSLPQLAADVNRLSSAARGNSLSPDDIGGSTFTISNVGTFGSLMGTPIINQPEAAILAFGIIKKRPEVITTSNGDEIAIRSMMFLSLSFDHRIIDGFLGGSFLKRVGENLENFTQTQIPKN